MISEKKRLEIANLCYAHVAGEFAMFMNPRHRGPNFTWEWWIKHCEESADNWVFIHNIRGHQETIKQTAKQCSREFALRLIDRAGILEK
jgi:hypothetical protein